MYGQPASQGAGPRLDLVGVGSGFPKSPPTLQSCVCVSVCTSVSQSVFSFSSVLPSLCSASLRHTEPNTAPSVTPDSRRGHPNRLAEPLAVPAWALLAHAGGGSSSWRRACVGPRMGLLMSLALPKTWYWTRKSGPDEVPPEILPHVCLVRPASDSPDFAIEGKASQVLYRPLGSICPAGAGEYCTCY